MGMRLWVAKGDGNEDRERDGHGQAGMGLSMGLGLFCIASCEGVVLKTLWPGPPGEDPAWRTVATSPSFDFHSVPPYVYLPVLRKPSSAWPKTIKQTAIWLSLRFTLCTLLCWLALSMLLLSYHS